MRVAQIYFVSFLKNTIFFELERDWTGLLIEPVPSFHMSILSKKRNIFSINACIANERPFIGKFRIYDALSGRLNKMHKAHVQRIDEISKSVKLLYVPCFSLNTIMSALGVNKVDYFSLDVEGGELGVLKSIKYDKLEIDSFSIEHNGFVEDKAKLIAYLTGKNFEKVKEDGQDVYFRSKKF